jgi:hypothetical protein
VTARLLDLLQAMHTNHCATSNNSSTHGVTVRFTWSQAVAMDAQGRALITDHGAFVLFNLYLPATTDPTSPRFQVCSH